MTDYRATRHRRELRRWFAVAFALGSLFLAATALWMAVVL